MRLIYVDDEQSSLVNFQFYAEKSPLVSHIEYFQSPCDALSYAERNAFDVAFLDIEMPAMNGFELARALKQLRPDIEVIYVTGFNNYHQEAYKSGGRAYLLKPYNEEVFQFLKKMTQNEPEQPPPQRTEQPPVFIQTFGNFDLWVNGEPVVFKTAKSKELLAVLINHRGCVVSNIEIFNFLWPNKVYSKSTATYVRKAVQSLKAQLTEAGCSDIVTFSRNAFFINRNAFVCDYFSTMAGDDSYLASYNGYYMAQYPWAEESIYIIEQSIKQLVAHKAHTANTSHM